MAGLPEALFVIDTRLETIAIKEAVKLGIPVIGVADTNCDPDEIDFIIPGNDDALRAIRLIADTIAQAYLDGKAVFEAQQKELAEQMEKQRQLQAQQAAAAREAAAKAAAAAAEARKSAEGKEPSEPGTPAEGASAEASSKPKTTFRKALQRKSKPRKTEPAVAADSAPSSQAADESAIVGVVGEPADEPKLS
jgi:small subunit ribosomal protein S2